MAKYLFAANNKGNRIKIVVGDWTTVAASDIVATGLNKVLGAVASLQDDAAGTTNPVTCTCALIAATPGSFSLKTWTSAAAAAGTFSKKVNWMAWGY